MGKWWMIFSLSALFTLALANGWALLMVSSLSSLWKLFIYNKIPAGLSDFFTFYFFSQGEWLSKLCSWVCFGSVISKVHASEKRWVFSICLGYHLCILILRYKIRCYLWVAWTLGYRFSLYLPVWRCSGLMVSACPNVQALARDIVMCSWAVYSYSASLNPGVQMHAWLWVMGHGLCLKIM